MLAPLRRPAVLLCASLLLATACASDEQFTRSGFLPSYDEMVIEDAPHNGKRLMWTSPDFIPANYDAVLLEKTIFFPEPKPDALVSSETLNQVLDHIDGALRENLEKSVRMVDTPGPGVARMSLALTAVNSETDELEPYQFIPVALVVTGAIALANGGLPDDAKLALEVHISDSVSRKPLLLMVRSGTGERLEAARVDGQRPVTPEALYPLIDAWAGNVSEQAGNYFTTK